MIILAASLNLFGLTCLSLLEGPTTTVLVKDQSNHTSQAPGCTEYGQSIQRHIFENVILDYSEIYTN